MQPFATWSSWLMITTRQSRNVTKKVKSVRKRPWLLLSPVPNRFSILRKVGFVLGNETGGGRCSDDRQTTPRGCPITTVIWKLQGLKWRNSCLSTGATSGSSWTSIRSGEIAGVCRRPHCVINLENRQANEPKKRKWGPASTKNSTAFVAPGEVLRFPGFILANVAVAVVCIAINLQHAVLHTKNSADIPWKGTNEYFVSCHVSPLQALTSSWSDGTAGPIAFCLPEGKISPQDAAAYNRENRGRSFVMTSGTESHFMSGEVLAVMMDQLISPAMEKQRQKNLECDIQYRCCGDITESSLTWHTPSG